MFLAPFSHSLNLLEKRSWVYCLSSHTHKSMEWYQFGMIFFSFRTRLIILWKENTLEFSFSCFSNSLNMKNTRVYFLWTHKTLHWKTLMGPNHSFFRFIKHVIEGLTEVELYQAFVILLKLVGKQRGTHPSWWGKIEKGKAILSMSIFGSSPLTHLRTLHLLLHIFHTFGWSISF